MSYQQQQYGGPPPDPQAGLPQGWIARWDQQSQHWFYVETSSGRTTWDRPGGYGAPSSQQYGGSGGGGGNQYGGQSQQYGSHQGNLDERGYHKEWSNYTDQYSSSNHQPPQQPPKKNHNLAYGALGVGAGVLGGMFLANEAGDIKNDFERDKYAVEGDFDRAKYDVEDAPENIAGWAGNKVGDVEGDYDRVKYGIEDAPEEAAGWMGRKVGNVEGDFDRVDDAYDDNRDSRRDERDDYGSGYNDNDY